MKVYIVHFNLFDDERPSPLTIKEIVGVVRKLELPAGVTMQNLSVTPRITPQGAEENKDA